MIARTICISMLLLLLTSCASQSTPQDPTPIPEDIEIFLERGPCFGACPVYSVTIQSDGTVLYQGVRFVEQDVEVQSSISQADLNRLVDAFEEAKFFDFEDAYNDSVEGICKEFLTDASFVTISITIDGTSKQVNHYTGCRGFRDEAELIALEDLIDEVVNTEQWIK